MSNLRFGLQKLTLLDFPGRVGCTVFTYGCNYRCPFCHNASLVTGDAAALQITEAQLLAFLEGRRKRLDGVAFTGGEPLLHAAALLPLFRQIRAMGFQIKLDTNGSFPEALREILAQKLVDYVAMDVKNSPAKYAMTCDCETALGKVRESLELLRRGGVEYELRTTVVGGFHEKADFTAIGEWIRGVPHYYLQKFKDSGDLLAKDEKMASITDEMMAEFLAAVKPFVPAAAIRGAQ